MRTWLFCIMDGAQWLGRFLGITTGWYPSVCKSNRLYVGILRFSYIKLGYFLYIPLKRSAIFLQSSTSTDNSTGSTSTGYFSNSTSSSVTNCQFSPIIDGAWITWSTPKEDSRNGWLTVCLFLYSVGVTNLKWSSSAKSKKEGQALITFWWRV